jgi:predicted RNA-binding protein with TRAM domain
MPPKFAFIGYILSRSIETRISIYEHKDLIVEMSSGQCGKLFRGFSLRTVKCLYGNDRGSFRGESFAPSAPVEAGKEYNVEIEDVAKKGDGIARIEGFVIFVPDTKVGDQVTIVVDRVMQRFAIGHKA